ncbi:MAG: DUF1122 family protein [Aquificota bacterium]|jgi:hypothetical protein|uniref:DUF1122 domain-containing protein n=1 Tax=Hydrogenobacter sp. TaxID=2152829 RepID=A0A7C2Z6K7_9AQUI|nr:MAG: DUF1122 family protein [Aquificota bacterium]
MEDFKKELSQYFYLHKVEVGRFVEEENITLAKDGKRLMYIKAFYGRKPYWKEWVELFHIDPSFFGSNFEDKLYQIISKYFRRVFVEYYEDKQTLEELKSGKPAEETRLGSKLKALGYKYFRDWYYPEGWMEGGYKLQAER